MRVLAERLQFLRGRKEKTQGQVAEYAQIARSSLSDLERGIIAPKTVDAIVKLADFYGVSTDYLLGRTDDPIALGRGKAPPPYAVEMIDLLRMLPRDASEELLNVGRGLLRLQQQANERLLQLMLAAIERGASPEAQAALMEARRAMAAGRAVEAFSIVDRFFAEAQPPDEEVKDDR